MDLPGVCLMYKFDMSFPGKFLNLFKHNTKPNNKLHVQQPQQHFDLHICKDGFNYA